MAKLSYESRLREFEYEKRMLQYKELTPKQYEQEIRRLANKWKI